MPQRDNDRCEKWLWILSLAVKNMRFVNGPAKQNYDAASLF